MLEHASTPAPTSAPRTGRNRLLKPPLTARHARSVVAASARPADAIVVKRPTLDYVIRPLSLVWLSFDCGSPDRARAKVAQAGMP